MVASCGIFAARHITTTAIATVIAAIAGKPRTAVGGIWVSRIAVNQAINTPKIPHTMVFIKASLVAPRKK